MSARRGQRLEVALDEVEELRSRLREAEETIAAIRSGEVDAIVVSGREGERVYTLETADRIYRFLIEQMNESAATTAPDGTILFCNSNFSRLVGVPAERVLGQSIRRFIDDDQTDQFEALFRDGVHGSAQGELRFSDRKGGRIPLYLSITALDSGPGQVISILATDLSGQRRNQEIVAQGRLASLILEQVDEATLVCDAAGTIVRASKVTADLTGCNPLRRRFDELFPLLTYRDRDPAQDGHAVRTRRFRLTDVRANTRVSHVEALCRRPDGRECNVLLSAGVLRNDDGQDLGWVVTMTDITAQKRLETELIAAKLAAEDAARAKADFLATMSHEIRTPMNGVLGMTELALLYARTPKVREYLDLSKQAGMRLLELLNNILDLSRIEAGKVDLEHEPFVLTKEIGDCLELLQPMAADKSLALSWRSDADVPVRLIGDPGRLRQIIINLVGNALKFTHHGRVEISVRLDPPLPANRVRLRFAVNDTGIGIPEKDLGRVFRSFTQGGSTHAKYGGSGLGLSIAKQLVELMGGTIWVDSQEGVGSVFSFTAEFSVVSEEQPATPAN